MRDIEIKMDWRHFWGCAVSIFAILFVSGVILLPGFDAGFDGIFCFGLTVLSALLSVVFAALLSGLRGIWREWREGNIYPSDLVKPALGVFGLLGAFLAATWLLPESVWKYVIWGVWSVMIVRGIVDLIARRRATSQNQPSDRTR